MKCIIKQCDKKAKARGMCPMHYRRATVYKHVPLESPNRNPNHGRGWHIDKDGYRQVWINKKYVREHRYVMEQHLGKALKHDECVHHRNGNKTDNRLSNLEVISFKKHALYHNRKIDDDIKRQAITLYRNGLPITKIPTWIPIGYSCAYWTIRNAGIPIRGRHNKNVKSIYARMGQE